MKKFSEFVIKESKKIEIQEDTVNYLSAAQIEKYLKIADKFISKEAKAVCKWLIDNNQTYIKDLSTGETDNAITDFFNKGIPSDSTLKELYSNITKINNSGRILEIPTLMTKDQFDSITDDDPKKRVSPDEVIMDLDSEAGRTAVFKKYEPLLHKIVNSWMGKTSFDRDDLYSAGSYGLTYAMNTYGKKSNKAKGKEEEALKKAKKEAEERGDNPDDITLDNIDVVDFAKYKSYTFLQYAAQMIRCWILEAIKNESHLVRIPISQQKRQKDEKGFIARSNSVSGDKHMGGKDGDEGKTLFDLVGGIENPGKDIDKHEIDKLWDETMDKLEEKFGPKTMDIFKNHFGFGLSNGEKRISGKEMAKKYGYTSPSSITAEITKVLNFIRKDSRTFKKFQDIAFLMREAKHDEDEYDNDNEPIYVDALVLSEQMSGLKNMEDWD